VGPNVGLGEGMSDGGRVGAGVGIVDGIEVGIGVGIDDGLGEGERVGYPVGVGVGPSVSNISQVSRTVDICTRKFNSVEYVPSVNKDHS